MNRFNGYFFACCWYFSTVFILNVRLVWWRRSTTTGCCWNISPPTSSSSWNISKCSNMPINQIMVRSHFPLVRTPHHAKQKCQKEIDSLSHSFNFQPWFPASLRGPWREEGWVCSTKDSYQNNYGFFLLCSIKPSGNFIMPCVRYGSLILLIGRRWPLSNT